MLSAIQVDVAQVAFPTLYIVSTTNPIYYGIYFCGNLRIGSKLEARLNLNLSQTLIQKDPIFRGNYPALFVSFSEL